MILFELIFRSLWFKVLGKSVKPVPVMLLGVLVAKKRYPLSKYLYVLLIVAGKNHIIKIIELLLNTFQVWFYLCIKNQLKQQKQ
jgi:uncharacterized membrane protein YjdF